MALQFMLEGVVFLASVLTHTLWIMSYWFKEIAWQNHPIACSNLYASLWDSVRSWDSETNQCSKGEFFGVELLRVSVTFTKGNTNAFITHDSNIGKDCYLFVTGNWLASFPGHDRSSLAVRNSCRGPGLVRHMMRAAAYVTTLLLKSMMS